MDTHSKLNYIAIFVLALGAVQPTPAHSAPPRKVAPASLSGYSRETFQMSMQSMESFWDSSIHLLRTPELPLSNGHQQHYMVRETSWYAFGLLMRDAPGDRQRASECLEAVLKEQFLDQSKPWYGTFRRTPEEGNPPDNAEMWTNYDPNWREFIGTTFEMILIEYSDRISPDLAKRMYASIDRAIEGEMNHGRLVPSYSNIALMYGALWDFAADHDKNPEWKQRSSEWVEEVNKLFRKYNS